MVVDHPRGVRGTDTHAFRCARPVYRFGHLRLGERRTLAQLSSFDFAVAVAIGAIIGRRP